MRMVQKWFHSSARKRTELGVTNVSYPYVVYSLESKGIYEPFRFYEETGWKIRGYSKEENRFYFNDIAEDNKISALGKMSQLMFGLRGKK